MSTITEQPKPGAPLPLGAQVGETGINFALFSRHAIRVTLLLFDDANAAVARRIIDLDPDFHRIGDIWHVLVENIERNCLYAWRVDGPYLPERGDRYNYHKMLLDPYATALAGTECWDFACLSDHQDFLKKQIDDYSTENDTGAKPKCLVPHSNFDWQGDRSPKLLWSDTIIYETHVRGLTVHPSSAVANPGTFLGVVEKIPYFQELGITAVELLPVHEFYENELQRQNPVTGERLRNYWGYSTVAFFAPKESYSSRSYLGAHVDEFKTMVRELHRAGIELIIDVVFNHTAEGNHLGPTLNFRGLDNQVYYLLENDRRYYKNYSGTGNTLNCNHPVVRDYILNCLHHWVIEMHVDGFRFDLASVLGRDANGHLLANPPLLERIAEDPVLRNVKLIAEAWDAGGAYQLGDFQGLRWSEWNDRYRDDVRRFWRGDPGLTGALANRICGSADIYQRSGKSPVHSINYITCHDGFTLNDLVSYKQKHNIANGENNADGSNDHYSDHYGFEGPSDDPVIDAFRLQQIKNMIATLLLSRGVPMLLGGDEFRRSQQGNNNAYCQDNAVSWYDWNLLDRHQELFRFVRAMIALRKRYPILRAESFYTADEIQWFGPQYTRPDWNGAKGLLGCLIKAKGNNEQEIVLLFNATGKHVDFILPELLPEQTWQILLDTAKSVVEQTNEIKTKYISEGASAHTVAAHSLNVLCIV